VLNRAYHERDREVGQELKMKGKGALGTRPTRDATDWTTQTGIAGGDFSCFGAVAAVSYTVRWTRSLGLAELPFATGDPLIE